MTDADTPTLIGGRFRIRALLGSGGTASVYEAIDVAAGGLVALKVLHPHLDRDPALRSAFLREAAIAAKISHPSVVRFVAAGDGSAAQAWTAWAFAPGVTLSELVRVHGPLEPSAGMLVVDRVLAALAAVHAAGFVHRDVSASNVLVQRSAGGEIVAVTLIDFGLANLPGHSARSADVLLSAPSVDCCTPAGVVGNPAYASPEHLRGEAVGVAGDLYQAGGLLHFALVGEPPFMRRSTDETIRAHLAALPPTVSVRVRGIAVDVDRVVVRALLKDPADRFPSAAAMRAALAAAAVAPGRGPTAPASPRAPAPAPASTPAAASATPPPTATRVLPAPVPASVPPTRAGASPMTWVLLSGAAILVGALVFALAPRGTPVEAQEPAADPTPSVSSSSAPSVVPSAPQPRVSVSTVPPEVPVPSVVGLGEAEARATLAAAGFPSTAQAVAVDGMDAAGTVVSTSPAPGSLVPPGAPVTLTVASGFTAVPDVRGETSDRAQYVVASAGLGIVVRQAASATVPAGSVIEVDPVVGARVAVGSRVTMLVSTGVAATIPTPTPTVPTRTPAPTPTPEPTP